MNARPRKHSLTLRGHRTSVTLEKEFWDAFRAAAARRDMAINELAARIDEERGTDCGLATAIRLFILRELTEAARAAEEGAAPDGPEDAQPSDE
ncbi:putative DNA-binding ribbon-helix-helix protein [Brevirhabdus pacifica]|uniref:ribbon-helix-helix domain-containing protein n=1 Tax=Brevirhabdus pacifica TaxID=1267768 RepID=UPI0009FA0BB1|nr:ribbon-helix-helix domain-containing protein [Brevirhabdus pacifica]PJJ86703.1 putative DNA-binding ribbon-helix-helix protein [Brevirhabdus pacifica]